MTANSETESPKQRLDDLHQQSEELEALLQNRSSIEVIDEDVPLVEIDGVEMIPVEQVEAWISPLQERIDELTDLAEQHREQRESIEQELNGLKRLADNPSPRPEKTWRRCTVNKAYKSQENLLDNGKYCALDPDLADKLGVTEDREVELRRIDNPENAAVYTVDEVRDQDAEVRVGKEKVGNASTPQENLRPRSP
jgi:TolA-binding protein